MASLPHGTSSRSNFNSLPSLQTIEPSSFPHNNSNFIVVNDLFSLFNNNTNVQHGSGGSSVLNPVGISSRTIRSNIHQLPPVQVEPLASGASPTPEVQPHALSPLDKNTCTNNITPYSNPQQHQRQQQFSEIHHQQRQPSPPFQQPQQKLEPAESYNEFYQRQQQFSSNSLYPPAYSATYPTPSQTQRYLRFEHSNQNPTQNLNYFPIQTPQNNATNTNLHPTFYDSFSGSQHIDSPSTFSGSSGMTIRGPSTTSSEDGTSRSTSSNSGSSPHLKHSSPLLRRSNSQDSDDFSSSSSSPSGASEDDAQTKQSAASAKKRKSPSRPQNASSKSVQRSASPTGVKKTKKPRSKATLRGGVWTEEEHQRFLQGLSECGHNWSKIAKQYVKTRVRTQVASHAQKYFQRVQKTEETKVDEEVSADDEL